ncbi:MAG: PAAR domain-containing protein, partial [Bacteroidota bacterium]
MPPAARLTDMHTCPMVTGTVPHVGGPITGPGVPTVLIANMPAAVVGDLLVCT